MTALFILYQGELIIKLTVVTSKEMLNNRIQQLETLFAELLGQEADSVVLGKIWTEIRMLRGQLEQLIEPADGEQG